MVNKYLSLGASAAITCCIVYIFSLMVTGEGYITIKFPSSDRPISLVLLVWIWVAISITNTSFIFKSLYEYILSANLSHSELLVRCIKCAISTCLIIIIVTLRVNYLYKHQVPFNGIVNTIQTIMFYEVDEDNE